MSGIFSALPIIGNLLDKVIPDVNARREAKEALESMESRGELNAILGQLAINKQEAAHKSLFVAGWRPFCGWVCGIGLFYNVILHPFLSLLVDLPPVDANLLYPVLLGMLGIGGLRSFEKFKNVAREK